jgi:hypothetical protein
MHLSCIGVRELAQLEIFCGLPRYVAQAGELII